MKRYWLGVAMTTLLAACGGGTNPFAGTTGGSITPPTTTVPDEVAGDVLSVSFDSTQQTLTISGSGLDQTPFQSIYTRTPALDVPGYQAYTAQDSSLDRHFTAYARERDGVYAVAAFSGPQFNYVIGGTHYGRAANETYDPPEATPATGLVSYAGTYAGLLNRAGDGGNLKPVTPGTSPSIIPAQAAEITGAIYLNADFADNVINGTVYNRVVVDENVSIADLDLELTSIASDGTFHGNVTQPPAQKRGEYAGIFGGTDASAVAGTLKASQHIHQPGYDNELEYGVFVLSKCGTANADPVCNQPVP